MDGARAGGLGRGFLSLRRQALIILSVVLLAVFAVLGVMVHRQATARFELRQSEARDNQVRQLRALLTRNDEEMARLVGLVPLLVPTGGAGAAIAPDQDFGDRLRRGLEADGTLLGLDWEVRSVFWIDPAGHLALAWPTEVPVPAPEFLAALAAAGDGVTQRVACRPECFQFLAAPVLRQGRPLGTLVLGRALTDALLAFNRLTGAEVAVYRVPLGGDGDSTGLPGFPAMSHPSRTAPIIRALAPDPAALPALPLGGGAAPGAVRPGELDGHWFELYRIEGLAAGLGVLVVAEVTAERLAIAAATRTCLLLGLGGLLLSATLLLWLTRSVVGRLGRITGALPLLAEHRYEELRARLPPVGGRLAPADELDRLSETVAVLTGRLEVLQRDREEAESRLAWLADHDSLTRLYNRRRFNEDFARVLDQAERFGHRGALLFLDLDQFKDVNDLSGHQVGDVMLQRVADQLGKLAHPSDVLARLGGDEFALVLPECSESAAVACAERVQAAVRSILVRERGRVHRATASIGIAVFPDQGLEPQGLLANADLAMFQAKEKGPGRWRLFSADDRAREQADARVTWRDKIAEGLRDERFELHLQPIVRIATGTADHWEALLRLRDAGGLVYPDRFIPVAEKTGQILAIDHWVVAQAIELLTGDPRLRLSVNLSAGALDDSWLLPELERRLRESAVDPRRLTFEVTETVAVASIARATDLMQGLQTLGCRFALDDFGSGYASYAYLRRLPVDDVKIDGVFIRDLDNNREDRIFVKSITEMAHGMGKQVTAEFVENAVIFEVLGDLGVDCAQGYYLGYPAPRAAFGPWPGAGTRSAEGQDGD